MGISTSVVEELMAALPALRPQTYFKTSLTALSHAMEDQVLAGAERPLVIASFQQERFYRQEAHRYERIAEVTDQVYVLAAAETSFGSQSGNYETVAFEQDDTLTQEWHLIVLGERYSACLICRERQPIEGVTVRSQGAPALDQTRRFEGFWTLDRQVCLRAADLLLARIQAYRPQLKAKLGRARQQFLADLNDQPDPVLEPDPFAQRLVTYLQAGQYKLLKAYRAIMSKEQRERLINSITSAIRQSLNPAEIFAIAVQELGQALAISRCIIYRCGAETDNVQIQHEYRQPTVSALAGQTWPLQDNPLYQWVRQRQATLAIEDTQADRAADLSLKPVQRRLAHWQVSACLLVPLIYQKRLLGMVELHLCQPEPRVWSDHEIELVEAIAAQLSVALIQAEAYANLEDLNQQLAALERTRSNLIAITGHELRTPLSTIRVCLESLNTEPDMPTDMQQVMLETAITDAERMRKLVQDFLTLSRIESGRIEWNLESLSLQECIDLALSSRRARSAEERQLPIRVQLPPKLPCIRADGEWMVEVLSKLIDNACKFTDADGEVRIQAALRDGLVEVTVADTGRGIEPNRLETVFERFYQEEGALRRSVGGTGLGLAICRQIIEGLGGQIWATSAGKNQGTQIHFTLPRSEDRSYADKPRSRTPARKAKVK
ncbi:GAF domain-containing protein [Romeria aff. gracilis LEGE 07310]|uniref:histidine kinase n=1 Tax=Vasconcelosia minhoensis LEGE 07310 TaxID=915328 RepID=A0A8J7DP72_9CYAN|nr:DICT sensory domain-containing protein [Romeria gracilis]MBE9079220.1 GAF domain-containing protein [Romeria aff. gracilis LEGE 07310]